MNAVIYARYSSRGQNEQSIEGQCAAIYEHAKRTGINITAEYIDRALTGTSAEKRDEFQRMIADSGKKQFGIVLVYSLDRFARDRYDSAHYKRILKKNGVRVVSVKENISDGPDGIILEAVLEGMAEYYSAELSQKVRRGVEISASKFRFTGGTPPLGFMVDGEKKYQIDPETAPIVQKIFEMYSAGSTVKEITDYMNSLDIKTSQCNDFNKDSLRGMLRNKRYIGTYIFRGQETPGAIPRIIDDILFYDVQEKLNKNKKAPARARAKAEYLLTTKIFCGYCREMMVGVSGTSKTGATHGYYACKSVWNKKGCKKKNVKKGYIESFVLEKAREQLTDENIKIICGEVEKLNRQLKESAEMALLNKRLKENAAAIENLLKALEKGEIADILMERIRQKNEERQTLESEINRLQRQYAPISEAEARFFFEILKQGQINDVKYQRTLIAIFIDSVYLYDDKIIIGFRTSSQPLSISYDLIDDIVSGGNAGPGSDMKTSAPPNQIPSIDKRNFVGGWFFDCQKVQQH